MRSSTCVWYSVVCFILCFVNLGYHAQILDLDEDEVCRDGDGSSSNHICRKIQNCPTVIADIQNNISPQICSFIGSSPVVCCPPGQPNSPVRPNPSSPPSVPKPPSRPNPSNPPSRPNPSNPSSRPKPPTPSSGPTFNIDTKPTLTNNQQVKPKPSKVVKTYSAAEMCREYSKLIYIDTQIPTLVGNSKNRTMKEQRCVDVAPLIVGGVEAVPMEFPHMVLLGYNEKPDVSGWRCGGSLISNRWILTAAHCEKSNNVNARWARLGDLNYMVDTDDAKPKDYKIEQRIIHPNYKKPSSYNDIALFRLEQNVEFSEYVRPLCLNTDQLLNPPLMAATGWGKTNYDEVTSEHLLKVTLSTISVNECNRLFYTDNSEDIPRGIDDSSMICSGYLKGGKDTCSGDSGGPIQIPHPDYRCMYKQIGLTSFGSRFCGTENSGGVYTRISYYISWIEKIVWPKNE